MTRRDKCYLIGRRAKTCNIAQCVAAWLDLSQRVEDMGDMDIPKFHDLIRAVRLATLAGKMINDLPDEFIEKQIAERKKDDSVAP